jgi:hypothetical protein
VQFLCKTKDSKAAAEENSLQIVKIVMIYFLTALSIEGHHRVPSLVGHGLMRFEAFRMEVIEIRWGGGVPWDHAMSLSSAGNLSYLSFA